MADIGKGLFLLVILAVLLGVGIVVWEHVTDPRIQEHRAWELNLAEQSRERLQPTLDLAKRVTTIIGILFLAGMALVVLRFLDSRVQRVYPMRGGLYPAREVKPSLFQRAAAFLLGKPMPETYFLAAPNQSKAQLAYAAANGLNPGVRLSAGVWRQLMKPDETAPEEEPLQLEAQLPTTISAYSAPLPTDEPALMLGNLGGRDLWFPLGRSSGHILCAASPGSGKTNWLQAAFVNATRYDPRGERIRFAITDLKEMDFALIPDMQALEYPVAYQPEDGLDLLEKLEAERIRRADLISAAGHVALEEYNASHPQQALPYLVAMFDEISGFMLHPDGEIGKEFARLAQKVAERGPASGMHLVLCTQRVSAKVIPGNISGICDTRLAFGVATDLESRMIVGVNGAETLPPIRGRFMYRYQREIGIGQAYYAYARDGRFLDYCQRLPRRKALPANAGADDDEYGNDAPSGVAPGVIGGLGGATGDPGGVINGDFTRLQGVTNTPDEVRSHSEEPSEADLLTRARDALPVTLDARARLNAQQSALVWDVLMTTLDRGADLPLYSMRQTHQMIWPDIEPGGHKARQLREAVEAEAEQRKLLVRAVAGRGIIFTRQNGRAVRINGGRQ